MRLPTRDDFRAAYKAKITELWEKKFIAYWTSDEDSQDYGYYFNISTGLTGSVTKNYDNPVRCLR